jgi:hypothetical protein
VAHLLFILLVEAEVFLVEEGEQEVLRMDLVVVAAAMPLLTQILLELVE